MARHARPEREQAIKMLAEGLSPREVSERLAVPYRTVASWAKRTPAPTKPKPAPAPAVERQPAPAPQERSERPPEEPEPAPAGVGPMVRHARLVGLSRTDYLADRISLLEDAIREMLSADSVAWSTVPRLVQVQDSLHSARVDIIRTEGTRLDLSRDPVAVAREAEALEGLLRTLALDLDDTPDL